MDEKIKVALIYGSARPGRFCDVVAGWAAQQITDHEGFSLDIIDPAVDAAGQQPNPQEGPVEPTRSHLIAEVDPFVLVAPEYKHGYPALLNSLIDEVDPDWH